MRIALSVNHVVSGLESELTIVVDGGGYCMKGEATSKACDGL